MTAEEMVAELKGLRCRCGAVKVPGQTFCRRCYYALSADRRRGLYLGVGKGYEPAYLAACAALEDKGITRAKRATEKDIADGLIKAALAGKTETCRLCGAEVLSVALHYISCPKVTGEESGKGRTKNPRRSRNLESTAGPVEKDDPKPPSK